MGEKYLEEKKKTTLFAYRVAVTCTAARILHFTCLLQGKWNAMGAEDLFSLELQAAIMLTSTFPSVQSLASARIWLSNCQCQKLDCILLKWLLLPNRKVWTHRCLHRSLPYFSRPRAALSTNQAVKCSCCFCVSCPYSGAALNERALLLPW